MTIWFHLGWAALTAAIVGWVVYSRAHARREAVRVRHDARRRL